MVEIFKTTIEEVESSDRMIQLLLVHFPQSKINFDLDDCDKILRVEGNNILPEKIIEVMIANGYGCEVLY